MILLPLTLAAVTAGCSTLSDSDVVARVNDVELTSDEFDAQLSELGVTGDEVVPLDPVRAELTRWIQQQLVPADEIAAIYDAGPAEAGVVCISAIVVADQAAAEPPSTTSIRHRLVEVFQRDNLDQSLTLDERRHPVHLGGRPRGQRRNAVHRRRCHPVGRQPNGHRRLLDDAGAEVASVALVFRSFDELDSVDAEQVTSLIDVTEFTADADVFVDSRYGTFDAATATVVSLS